MVIVATDMPKRMDKVSEKGLEKKFEKMYLRERNQALLFYLFIFFSSIWVGGGRVEKENEYAPYNFFKVICTFLTRIHAS